MKKILALVVLALALTQSGCFLIPKNVEFFQKKVPTAPELYNSDTETLRKAVDFAQQRATDLEKKLTETQTQLKIKSEALVEITKKANSSAKTTVKTAVDTQADNRVIESATETSVLTAQSEEQAIDINSYIVTQKLEENARIISNLTKSIQSSVGIPKKEVMATDINVKNILDDLRAENVRHTQEIKNYFEKMEKLEGKKVEGTGLIRVSYFTALLVVILIPIILFIAVKIFLVFNPAVGASVSVAGGVAKKALSEVVYGGERFKNLVKSKYENAEDILTDFRVAHETEHSTDTKEIIKKIT